MLDDFREDDIVRKMGGRFKLSTLVQKRMVALNRGAQPLIDLPTRDLLHPSGEPGVGSNAVRAWLHRQRGRCLAAHSDDGLRGRDRGG